MIYIGLDPGASGGLAWIDGDEEPGFIKAAPFAETEHDIAEQLRATFTLVDRNFAISCQRQVFAVIESVHSFPGQGIASSFAFGRSYGFLRGLLVGFAIPFESVTPAKWQRAMAVPRGEKSEKKRLTKARAQELMPWVKWTHRTADAGLLAEYCRMTRARTLQGAEATNA